MHVYSLYALCTHTAVMRTRTLRAYLPLLASMHVWHACISMHMLRTPDMHLSCIRLMHDVRMYGNYMYCVTVTMYGIFMLHAYIAHTYYMPVLHMRVANQGEDTTLCWVKDSLG